MFWGSIIKPSMTVSIDENALEGCVLHVSQACLGEKVTAGRNLLMAKTESNEDEVVIASLAMDTNEQVALDLFFDEPVEITNKGSSDIHITGYVEEREGEEGPEDMDFDSEDEEEEIKAKESSEPKITEITQEETPKKAAPVEAIATPTTLETIVEEASDDEGSLGDISEGELERLVAEAKANGDISESSDDEEGSDDEEMIDEDDEEETGDESDLEGTEEMDIESESDDEEGSDAIIEGETSDEEAEIEIKTPTKEVESKKRKQPDTPVKETAAKKTVTATTPAATPASDATSPSDAWANAMVEFVKASGGKSCISALGGKCKRPEGVNGKLKAFLNSRSKTFKVDGDKVTLC